MRKNKISKKKRTERKEMLPKVQALWESDIQQNWEVALIQAEALNISATRLCRVEWIESIAKDDRLNQRMLSLIDLFEKKQYFRNPLRIGAIIPLEWKCLMYIKRLYVGIGFKWMRSSKRISKPMNWSLQGRDTLPLNAHQRFRVGEEMKIVPFYPIP